MPAPCRGILLGSRTYQDVYAWWPNQTDNPFTEMLNNTNKYVAPTTLTEPLPWRNSTLLKGDAANLVRLSRDAGYRHWPELLSDLARRLDESSSGKAP